jgi:hypothetical protein
MPREAPRHVLRFTASTAELLPDNSWRLSKDNKGVEVCLVLGNVRYQLDVELRWRMLCKATFVAPADTDRTLWITQPVALAKGLLVVSLQLERASAEAAKIMSAW